MPANKEACYDAWAPQGARWSAWAKPVLFACMDTHPPTDAIEPEFQIPWRPENDEAQAIVVDLVGAKSIAAGLALARIGWRPVPLYNAIPVPTVLPDTSGNLEALPCAVNVRPIMAGLWNGAALLTAQFFPEDAPPAFLLDAGRRGWRPADIRSFDNRSLSFPTDFPSANTLLSYGIRRVLLIQESGDQPQHDLAHTLRRWQEAGIELALRRLYNPEQATPLIVERPSGFGRMWHRLLASLGLQTNALGGYGGVLDETGSAG